MLTSRVATTATRINYRRHFSTDVSFEQTHPNSRQRVSRKVIVINWRRLRIRENEKERKEISKRDSYPNFSSMEEKNFSEGIWMELRDQRGTEERKKERNFALVTCPLLFFSESPRPDALLAIEFFRGRRKAQHPLWPSFRKMARVRWHQSLRNPLSPPSIAKFENRWILVSRVFQPNSLQEHWEGQSCTREQRYSITNFAFLVPSSRTVARFSGRAVIFIYSNLDAHKIECNDFLFWR